jgi:hypothetical protein
MPELLCGIFRNLNSFRGDRWNEFSLLEHRRACIKVDLPIVPNASLKSFQKCAVCFSERLPFTSLRSTTFILVISKVACHDQCPEVH